MTQVTQDVTFKFKAFNHHGFVALQGNVKGMNVPYKTQIGIYTGGFPSNPNDDLKDWVWLQDAGDPGSGNFYVSKATWGPGWNVAISQVSQELDDDYIYVVQGTTPEADKGITESATYHYSIMAEQRERGMYLDAHIHDGDGHEIGHLAPHNCQLAVYTGDFPDDPNDDLKNWRWYQDTPFRVDYGGAGWNFALSCANDNDDYAYITAATTD